MATNVNVRRLAQQKTRVTLVGLQPIPDPPPALARIPGVSAWWKEMRTIRERDQQAISNMLLTDVDIDGGGA